jgi:hypothetical protein
MHISKLHPTGLPFSLRRRFNGTERLTEENVNDLGDRIAALRQAAFTQPEPFWMALE